MELTDFKSTDRLANSSYFANNLVAGHLGEFGTSPSVVDLMNIYIYELQFSEKQSLCDLPLAQMPQCVMRSSTS